MLKLKFNNLFLGLSFLSILVPFQVMSMSEEESVVKSVVAKLVADVSLRADRAAKKQQGGYSDAVYNTEFSVLPDKAIKTTGKFKAFGLAERLDEEAAFKELIEKDSKVMIVEFYPGVDIFGNVIDPVQWSCADAACTDSNCAIDLSKVPYCVFLSSKK